MQPDRQALFTALSSAGIPFILIGAQALRFYGSPRNSYDIDFAIRTVDIDSVLEHAYQAGYRLPVRVDTDGSNPVWAKNAAAAGEIINREKRGALNLFFLNNEGYPVDQIDFVYDNPVPFAKLNRNAAPVNSNPPIRCASPADLLSMKEKRLQNGQGSNSDRMDVEFLHKLLENTH